MDRLRGQDIDDKSSEGGLAGTTDGRMTRDAATMPAHGRKTWLKLLEFSMNRPIEFAPEQMDMELRCAIAKSR